MYLRCCSDYTLTLIGRMLPFLSISPIEAFPLPLSQISLIHLPDLYDLIILKATSHRCLVVLNKNNSNSKQLLTISNNSDKINFGQNKFRTNDFGQSSDKAKNLFRNIMRAKFSLTCADSIANAH